MFSQWFKSYSLLKACPYFAEKLSVIFFKWFSQNVVFTPVSYKMSHRIDIAWFFPHVQSTMCKQQFELSQDNRYSYFLSLFCLSPHSSFFSIYTFQKLSSRFLNPWNVFGTDTLQRIHQIPWKCLQREKIYGIFLIR